MKGSVREVQRAEGVAYRATIDLPTNDGTRRRKTKTHDSEAEAKRWLIKWNHRINEGEINTGRDLPLGEWLWEWHELNKGEIATSTRRKRERCIRIHIDPEIGGVMLSDLTPFHLQEYFKTKSGELSDSTLKIHYALIRRALDIAKRQGMVKKNVTDQVERPTESSPEINPLDEAQTRKLIDTAYSEDYRYATAIHTAVMTGLRRGEILGLTWNDVDLDRGRISVVQQLSRGDESFFELTELKTDSSQRQVLLTDGNRRKLAEWRKRLLQERMESESWGSANTAFQSSTGNHVSPGNLRRQFKKVLDRAGLPDIRFHDLRHTHATLLLSEGIHPSIVQERLGHEKIETTLNVYSHVMPTMQEEAVQSLKKIRES